MESDTHSSTSQPQHQEYFPQVPTVHEPSAPTLSPITMGPANTAFPDINHADHSYPPPPPEPTQSLTSFPTSTSTGPPPMGAPQQPVFQSPSLPTLPSQFYTGAPSPMVSAPQSPPSTHGQFQPSTSHQQQQEYRPRKEVTPEDMVKAQKFAKWAVSALDYEDVENAIEQFRNGLKALGAL